MDCMNTFDVDFYNYSEKIFKDGRVSVFPKIGKMSGAYASYNKDHKSFVMLNHNPDLDSVMIMAHELGHAIHGFYSQEQNGLVYHSPLCLAETASIFNETLLFDNILNDCDDNNKIYLLFKNLDDIFSTMFRQIMYVDFELEAHNRTFNGEQLSYEDFNEIWFRKTSELYGDSVTLPDYVKYGWARIPHIYQTPFYCYAYTFGNILSFNLYKMYKNDSNFIEVYKKILKSGGSKRVADLLFENNIDINSEIFYDNAFSIIEEKISLLEKF